MKTFIIKEVRTNEKNEAFEVRTKMRFESIEALIRHLKASSNTLWDGCCAIQEEGNARETRHRFKKEARKTISTSLPYGEEYDREDD